MSSLTGSFDSSALSSESQPSQTSTPSTLQAVPWTPIQGPQARAYESAADITGYGGGAGGGKSYLEIGLAVTRHRRAIIFRREQRQVRDLWLKLTAVCGTHGRSNENLLTWRGLPGDRQVTLAGVKNERDWIKFQGHEYDLYAFDEAAEFSETQVRTLIAWNRTPIMGQRCRVVLSFNPPTSAEGQWIVDFFGPWLDPDHPNPAEPGELRWFAVIDGTDVERTDGTPFEHNGETIYPKSRTFIPARLEDNPILEATGYRATLQNVPEPLRSQLLYGDFSVGTQDHEWQVIPTSWVLEAQRRWTRERPTDTAQTAIGCDVAQGGNDNSVRARRYGLWVAEPEITPGRQVPDANENARLITMALAEGGYAVIDVDGLGAATYWLLNASLPARVRPFQGSSKSVKWQDHAKVLQFFNVRAAAYWNLRQLLDPARRNAVALPPGRQVLADLTAARWFKAGDKVQLEKKDDIKERLGRSPDVGDAIVMAFWDDPSTLVAQAFAQSAMPDVRAMSPQEARLPWNRDPDDEYHGGGGVSVWSIGRE